MVGGHLGEGPPDRRERRLHARRVRRQRVVGFLVLMIAAAAVVVVLSMQRGTGTAHPVRVPERSPHPGDP